MVDYTELFFNFTNVKNVFPTGASYTSMEFFAILSGLFIAFLLASLFLNGDKKPFEKLFSAIIAFVLSVVITFQSLSLSLIRADAAGYVASFGVSNDTIYNIYYPFVVMQNPPIWTVGSAIIAVLCFVNIINCILVLMDYSRNQGGVKRNEF